MEVKRDYIDAGATSLVLALLSLIQVRTRRNIKKAPLRSALRLAFLLPHSVWGGGTIW